MKFIVKVRNKEKKFSRSKSFSDKCNKAVIGYV